MLEMLLNYWYITILPVSVILFAILYTVFYRAVFKRLTDIILSATALILLLPLLAFLMVLVRVKLGSPVLFCQLRPGKNGKIFKMHKLRTMTTECDSEGNLLPDSVRLTRFGRILRASSLDELPELFDILRGKMSLIGPRPQLVKDMAFMDENARQRHAVRPGLTGLAQVNGRNNVNWDKRLEYDLEYVRKVTPLKDLAIFFKTIAVFFKFSDVNTEGMATSQDYGDWLLDQNRITQEQYQETLSSLT